MVSNQSSKQQRKVESPSKKSFNFFTRDPSVKITQEGVTRNKMRVASRKAALPSTPPYEQQHILTEEFYLPHYQDRTSTALQTRMVGEGHLSHWFLNGDASQQQTPSLPPQHADDDNIHTARTKSTPRAEDKIQTAPKTKTVEGIKKKRSSHPPKDKHRPDHTKYLVVMPYAIPFPNMCQPSPTSHSNPSSNMIPPHHHVSFANPFPNNFPNNFPHDAKQSPVLIPHSNPSPNINPHHHISPFTLPQSKIPNVNPPPFTRMSSHPLHSELLPPSYEEAISYLPHMPPQHSVSTHSTDY